MKNKIIGLTLIESAVLVFSVLLGVSIESTSHEKLIISLTTIFDTFLLINAIFIVIGLIVGLFILGVTFLMED